MFRILSPPPPRCGLLALAWLLALFGVSSASGLIKIDFEQKYFVHPGRQVWDFCALRSDSVYHIFYHSILESAQGAANADTIWQATSRDLFHWTIVGPALTSGPDWWDAEAVWAPDVVRDPATGQWVMAYTGVDSLMVQRPCLATSCNLSTWAKSPANPIWEPDSLTYYWSPTTTWSSYRDPFLYRQGDRWHMLSTASLRLGTYPGYKRGIIHHLASTDLGEWTDEGVFFVHDGESKWHDLESCQYHQRGSWHHLFFTEQDSHVNDHPTSHIACREFGEWSMADRSILDPGWAPEVDRFEPTGDIFARLGKGWLPVDERWFIVVRFDTLVFTEDGAAPLVSMPHPLDRDWAVHAGPAVEANPTFGDNVVARGGPPCGMVGNGWFSSREYYQGPLSGYGVCGATVGDGGTGLMRSYPFVLTGDLLSFRIGGGYFPETCYIALLDAAADTVLLKETGRGNATMTPCTWNVRPYRGRLAIITIVDDEQAMGGYISIDEIEEIQIPLDADHPRGSERLLAHRSVPNPGNPAVAVRFELAAAAAARLLIYDVKGRLVWRSARERYAAGGHSVVWRGRDRQGRLVPAGVYVYAIEIEAEAVASGKITIVR
jgi:hypothetical protein